MECKRCKEVYGKELFRERALICENCREEARIRKLEYNKEFMKQYRASEEGRAKRKEYRASEEGKAKIEEYRLEKYFCKVCNCEVLRKHKARHERTRKHTYNVMKVGEDDKGGRLKGVSTGV